MTERKETRHWCPSNFTRATKPNYILVIAPHWREAIAMCVFDDQRALIQEPFVSGIPEMALFPDFEPASVAMRVTIEPLPLPT